MIDKLKPLIPRPVKKNIKRLISLFRKSPRYTECPAFSSNILNGLIAYNRYGGYCIPISSKHRPAAQKILSGSVYEPNTINYILDNCAEGDVVHAGTYYGDFLPALSEGLFTNAILWAFEPNVENFRCAQITLILNNLNNTTLQNLGLGNAEKKMKMLIESRSGIGLGGTSRILTSPEEGKTVNIDIVRLDDHIPRERIVSIIQLDVEGYEKEALEGALKTIQRCKPILIIEDNKGIRESKWFSEHILSLGYLFETKIHHNHVYKMQS